MTSDEDILLGRLWCEAVTPARNAATLTHNLAVAFRYLETPWDDAARRIIGALVTVNAGAMHTTVWAALFQQLRETDKSGVKVHILKQFANVCWTVPTSQGENAFRAFALEVRPLLSDTAIVANATFQNSFTATIRALGPFADKNLSDELFAAVYAALQEWKRVDAVRATATIAAAWMRYNPHAPQLDQFIRRAKFELETFSYAILLDTLAAEAAAESARDGGEDSHTQWVAALCSEVDDVLAIVVASPKQNEKVMPPCFSAYRRLRLLSPTWEAANATALTRFIAEELRDSNLSKLLRCPFLQFLHDTSCDWARDGRGVWALTTAADPFVRADALSALIKPTTRSTDTSEKRLVLADMMARLRNAISEHCSYTTAAILKFVNVLLVHSDFPPASEEHYLCELLHLCRRHGKGLYDDVPAQLELFGVFAGAKVAPEPVLHYALEVFATTHDRGVARRAFDVILSSCSLAAGSDALRPRAWQSSEGGGFCSAQSDVHDPLMKWDQNSRLLQLQSSQQISAVLFDRLCTLTENEGKRHGNILVVCDAVKQLVAAHCDLPVECDISSGSIVTVLFQVLQSHEVTSSDAYVALLDAVTTCLQHASTAVCANAPLLCDIFQVAWSGAVSCAGASLSSSFLPSNEATHFFFCTNALPPAYRSLIAKCKDVALSNDLPFHESAFHDIMAGNLRLLSACLAALTSSPLFLAELYENMQALLSCCATLCDSAPQSVLCLLLAAFDVVDPEPFPAFQRAQKADGTLAICARLSHPIVKRAVGVGLSLCCPELCRFLRFFVTRDAAENGELFAEVTAGDWSLLNNLFSFCTRVLGRPQSHRESTALTAVLHLFAVLSESKYAPFLSATVTHEAVAALESAVDLHCSASSKGECSWLLARWLARYNTSGDASFSKEKCATVKDAAVAFFEQLEVLLDLWNASDTEAQQQLLSDLTKTEELDKLVCAAALDVCFIPGAVEEALTSPCPNRAVLDILLLLLAEAETECLPPLPFSVEDAVFGTNDDLVESIIRHYRWGWCNEHPRTVAFFLRTLWQSLDTPLCKFLMQVADSDAEACASITAMRSGDDYFFSCEAEVPCAVPSFWQCAPGVASVAILRCENETYTSTSFVIRVSELLQLRSETTVFLLGSLCSCDSRLADFLTLRNIRLLGSLLTSQSGAAATRWEPLPLLNLLQHAAQAATDALPGSEVSLWLQEVAWLLFRLLQPFSEQPVPSVSCNGSTAKSATRFFRDFLEPISVRLANLLFCSSSTRVEEVATSVFRFACRNPTLFATDGAVESLFWAVARHCIREVWSAVSSETVAFLHDPDVLSFLCRAHLVLRLPLPVQKEAHALLTPQLLSYGDMNGELEEDDLRCILWLVSGFSCATAEDQLRGNGVELSGAARNTGGADKAAVARKAEQLALSTAIWRVLADLAQSVLANVKDATPSNVLDAAWVLQRLTMIPSISPVDSLMHIYRMTRELTERYPILPADFPTDSAAHCLSNHVGHLPHAKRVYDMSDMLLPCALTSLMTEILCAWLRDSSAEAAAAALPAQLLCALALYVPCLTRCDLASYLCALHCLRRMGVRGMTSEVQAVYDVALPRLMEDLVDAPRGASVDGLWHETVVAFFSSAPGAVPDNGRQLVRRVWEGLWRCVDAAGLADSQHAQRTTQQSLQHVLEGLTVHSAQWELCRLVILNTALQQQPQQRAALPAAARAASEVPALFWMANELRERTWRSQVMQTQAAFVSCGTTTLDRDSARTLLFEFDNAVKAVYEPLSDASAFAAPGSGAPLVVAERTRDRLLGSAEAVLAALNHFEFAAALRRRAVLRALAKRVTSASPRTGEASGAGPIAWADVYFDVLYERAVWLDEGLWVACALAATVVGKSRPFWSVNVLASLTPATPTRWKRELMRRIGQQAKAAGAQQEARQFFADAADRLSALRTAPPAWKTELLAAVAFVFASP